MPGGVIEEEEEENEEEENKSWVHLCQLTEDTLH